MITKKSSHDVRTTLDRLEAALKEQGIAVVARVDHAAAAQNADMTLRPTQVLIFGNPRLGTPLMQSDQRMGIDLPLKALAWEDENGQTWVGYVRPQVLAERHGVADRKEIVARMTALLDKLTDGAIEP